VETLVGITLGGYTLTRVLGSGGMGTVYLAEDKAIGQQVAIKVVRTDNEDYSSMESAGRAAERFRQEARAVASLDHLHILPLYRYGEEETANGPRAYMVMQYRPEGSLWDWLRKRAGRMIQDTAGQGSGKLPENVPAGLSTTWPLSVEEAADYLHQAASALQYAHNQGIVHRDIKPANFLLRFDQNHAPRSTNAFLLLSDFGLAKFFSAVSSTSNVFGTPMYMAPEQFAGIAGPGSDQYALAVMIYYLLAGRPPFSGDPIVLLNQHLNVEPAPIRTYAPHLSRGVEMVLARALAKKPEQRYPTIATFADEFIQRMQEGQPVSMPAFAPPKPFSLPAHTKNGHPLPEEQKEKRVVQQSLPEPYNDLAALPQGGVTSDAPTRIESGAHAPLSRAASGYPPTYPAHPSPAQFSPSPAQPPTAPASGEEGVPVSQLQTQMAARSTITTDERAPQPRTDRRQALGWLLGGVAVLGIGAGAGLYFYGQQQSSTTKQQTVPKQKHISPASTASTGQPARAKEIRSLLTGHSDFVTALAWSPDGTQLASGSLDHTVRLWNLATQQTTVTYTGHQQGVLTVAWSRDGKLLASGGKDADVQIWDTMGSLKQTVSNLGTQVRDLAWSADSSSLFAGAQGLGLREITLGKSTTTPILSGERAVGSTVAVSADGKHLATGNDLGAVSIFELPTLKRVTTYRSHTLAIRSLAWSPDNTQLALVSIEARLLVLNALTGATLHTLTHDSVVNGAAWEPAGSGRLATATKSGNVYVWNVPNETHIVYGGHRGPASAIAWGAQGLASGALDYSILIWNV